MDKKNNNINAIYDDSVSSGAILKDAKKKLGKRVNINIDNISVEEDMFYQKEERTNFRMIVLKENCSYEMLAARYSVDIHRLRKLNGDKILLVGTLVVLP